MRKPLDPLKIQSEEKSPKKNSGSESSPLPSLRRMKGSKSSKTGEGRACVSLSRQESSKQTQPKEKPKRVAGSKRRTGRIFFVIALGLFVMFMGTVVGATVGVLNNFLEQMPRIEYLENYQPYMPSRMWDRVGIENGVLIADFFGNEQSRQMVTLSEMPENLINAVICTEDRDFYNHFGVSLRGVVRAAIVDIKTWSKTQGASTISMQLAEDLIKNNHLGYELEKMSLKDWRMKIYEVILALQMEKRYTKDEIMEIYLNQVFLGGNVYGVARAAETYFGKDIKDLSLKECALFAGMLKRPNGYIPTDYPVEAQRRTELVLRLMRDQGKITPEQYEQAVSEPFILNTSMTRRAQIARYPYYSEAIRRQFKEQEITGREGDPIEILGQGVDIETVIDRRLQEIAEAALRNGIEEQERHHRKNGGKYWGAATYHSANVQKEKRSNGIVLVKAGGGVLKHKVEYDAKIVKPYDAETSTIEVTIPNIDGGKGPFIVPVNLDKTWLDEFECLEEGYYVRVVADENEEGGLHFRLGNNRHVQGSLVAVKPSTGEVLALAGGHSFYDGQNNGQYIRAVQAHNIQPGSSFKPLLYASALADPSNKWTVASRIQDVRTEFWNGWVPRNYEGHYNGNVSMRYALTHSLNSGSVWLLDNLKGSRRNSIQYFQTFLRQAFNYNIGQSNLSMALGTAGMTPWQVAQAYQVLANQGRLVELHMVNKVYQRRDSRLRPLVLYEFKQPLTNMERMTPQAAYLATYLLRNVVEDGTGKPALELPFYSVGKTGTTDECTYAWYTGYSKDILCIVYLAHDDFTQSLGIKRTGSKVALPVWMDFMAKTHEYYPDLFGEPPVPDNIEFKMVCDIGRQIASPGCPKGRVFRMPFIIDKDVKSTAPRYTCGTHGGGGSTLTQASSVTSTTRKESSAPYQYVPNPSIFGRNE